MRNFVVGTQNSITALAMENGWTTSSIKNTGTTPDYIPIKSVEDARLAVSKRFPNQADRVYITYGFKLLSPGQALGISDILIAAGFTRDLWRYV